MYPVRLGIKTAKKRVQRLIKNGHHSEALLTSVFTFEKTIHRTLRQLMVSAGLRSKDADLLLTKVRGFKNQKEIWSIFDPSNRNLQQLLDNRYWQHISSAVKMRNDLVHGSRAYDLNKCRKKALDVLDLIEHTINTFNDEYGYCGWDRLTVRKISTLHKDPKISVKINYSNVETTNN